MSAETSYAPQKSHDTWPQTTDCNWHSLFLTDTLCPEASTTQSGCKTDTSLQAFPDIVQSFGAHRKPASMYFASRPPPLLAWDLIQIYLKFSTTKSLYLIGYLSGRSGVFTKREFLLFLTGTFAILPINLSTSGRQSQSECLCTATPLHIQTLTRRNLALPSSLQGRTIRPQVSLCLPPCNIEHKTLEITDLNLHPGSRILSPWSTHSTWLVSSSKFNVLVLLLCIISATSCS